MKMQKEPPRTIRAEKDPAMKQNEANKTKAAWKPHIEGKTVLFVPEDPYMAPAAGISGGGRKRSKKGLIAFFLLLLLIGCIVFSLNRKETGGNVPGTGAGTGAQVTKANPVAGAAETDAQVTKANPVAGAAGPGAQVTKANPVAGAAGTDAQVTSGHEEKTEDASGAAGVPGQVTEGKGPGAQVTKANPVTNTGTEQKAESEDVSSVAESNARAGLVAEAGNNTSQPSFGGAMNIPSSTSAGSSSVSANTGAGGNAGAGASAVTDSEARARDAAEAERQLNWACEYYWNGRSDLYQKCIQKSAELGNAWAQACYGSFFLDGTFRRNELEAEKWFRKAADQGCLLGYDMLKRAGALKGTDAEKAKKTELESERWLARAFELHYQGNYDESLRYLKMAAERGNAWAQLYCGEYLWRKFGTGNDKPSALALLNMSAGQSCPGALYDLSKCYQNGDGVNRSESTAAALYNKYQSVSAEAENLLMQANELNRQGNPAATDYLRLAAERGNAWAQMCYGEYLGDNNTAGRDEAAAVSWFFLSATAYRCPQACFCLGWCYENGRGVNADLNLAGQGYQEAANSGVNGAQTALYRVRQKQQR